MSFWIGDRKHAFVHEGADGLLDQPLFVGELEVHGGNITDAPPAARSDPRKGGA